jgi:exosortase A-associated hydrolase 2
MNKAHHTRPGYLDAGGRRLFTLEFVPAGPCRGAVLYLPPFAEEMNRLRSHVAAQARALAAGGWHCLLLDPSCTGESEGELIDADWDRWRADGQAAAQALRARSGHPVQLWGARTGALLASELAIELAAQDPSAVSRLLLWQPVLDGKQFLTQYLRLRVASLMVSDAQSETTEQIRARLDAGEVVEVAGYPLAGTLARGLSTRRMQDLVARLRCPVLWLEVASKPEQPLLPASRGVVEKLRAQGLTVHTATPVAPLLWQVHDRAEAPELIASTLALMEVPA